MISADQLPGVVVQMNDHRERSHRRVIRLRLAIPLATSTVARSSRARPSGGRPHSVSSALEAFVEWVAGVA